jgi:hypothetical protein
MKNKRGRPRKAEPTPRLKNADYKPSGGRYAPESEWRKAKNIGTSEYKSLVTDKEKSTFIPSKQRNIAKIRKIQSKYSKRPESQLSASAKKRKAFRAGKAKGQTKAVYSGFKIQMDKQSLGALLALGIRGKIPTSNKMAMSMKKASQMYLKSSTREILIRLKEFQLASRGSGILYPRILKHGQLFINHRASRAGSGDAPANLSGELASSYTADVQLSSTGSTATFTNEAIYANSLVQSGRRLFNALKPNTSSIGILNPVTAKAELWSKFTSIINSRYQNFK